MERVIPFMKYKFVALAVSAILFVMFFTTTNVKGGFNWGIDFIGGVKLTAKFTKDVNGDKIREVLDKNKVSSTVQLFGKEEDNVYIIATKLLGEEKSSEKSYEVLKGILDSNFQNTEFVSVETVGPAIGSYLKKSTVYSFIIVAILMTLYLWFRFDIKFAIGTIVALIHDIVLCIGFAGLMHMEIDTPVMAALLTVFGYSANDTIVIFDRIREDSRLMTKVTFSELVDKAITQTLSRTLLTGTSTLFAIMALYVIGGDTINSFALILLLGIITGTYSSIYIATPFALLWDRFFQKKHKES